MRAVVLHEYGGPEKLKFEDNVPEPQISGSTVLIVAAAASVNPIDWKLRSGMRQKDSPLSFPAILGGPLELAGEGRELAIRRKPPDVWEREVPRCQEPIPPNRIPIAEVHST